MNSELVGQLAQPFLNAAHRAADYIPNFAAAFLLLLVGMFMARAMRTVAEKILARAKLDEYTSKIGINEMLTRLGLGKSPSFGISFLIYWFILFVFIVSAANAVNMTAVSEMIEKFLMYLPLLIAAILILFGGLLFARFRSRHQQQESSGDRDDGLVHYGHTDAPSSAGSPSASVCTSSCWNTCARSRTEAGTRSS